MCHLQWCTSIPHASASAKGIYIYIYSTAVAILLYKIHTRKAHTQTQAHRSMLTHTHTYICTHTKKHAHTHTHPNAHTPKHNMDERCCVCTSCRRRIKISKKTPLSDVKNNWSTTRPYLHPHLVKAELTQQTDSAAPFPELYIAPATETYKMASALNCVPKEQKHQESSAKGTS